MEDRSIIERLMARPELGPFVLLVVEIGVFWAINPYFLSPQNIANTLAFTVELGLIALAMTLLMTSGEFDLSVGSLFGFAPVLMWTLFNAGVTSLEIAFIVALLVAALIGLVNGLFVTRLRILFAFGDTPHAARGARHGAVHHGRLSPADLERRGPMAC